MRYIKKIKDVDFFIVRSEANTSWSHFGSNTFFQYIDCNTLQLLNPLMENFIHLSFTCSLALPVLTDAAHIHRTVLSTVLVLRAGTTTGTESIVLLLLGLILRRGGEAQTETAAQQTQREEH